MLGINHIEKAFKLDAVQWEDILEKGEDYFTAFPFLDDPKFKALKPSRQRFILAYTLKDLKGFNLYDCYLFAQGYKRGELKTLHAGAGATGYKNKEEIKYFLDKIDDRRVYSMGFSTTRIVEEETALAYSDITELLDNNGNFVKNLKELPAYVRRTIKTLTISETEDDKTGEITTSYKFTLWDKGQALNRLHRVKGNFNDKVSVTGPDGGPIESKLTVEFIDGEKPPKEQGEENGS